MIACSACGSALVQGSSSCPNCHLPITAQAVRVHKRRTSTLLVVLMVLLGIAAGSMIVGHVIEASDAPKHGSLLADFDSGKLSSPEAFQARCGNAISVADRQDAKVLSYNHGELLVKLTAGSPVRFYQVRPVKEHGTNGSYLRNYEAPVGAQFALEHLTCAN